ncbi:MAG: peptidoglycan-binding protein [Myxococcales bacterium]|nr:peptidoglycan-binding protein [Myxococcales bacterium]
MFGGLLDLALNMFGSGDRAAPPSAPQQPVMAAGTMRSGRRGQMGRRRNGRGRFAPSSPEAATPEVATPEVAPVVEAAAPAVDIPASVAPAVAAPAPAPAVEAPKTAQEVVKAVEAKVDAEPAKTEEGPAPGTMGHRPTGDKMGSVWDSNKRDVANMDLELTKSQQGELDHFKKVYAANLEKYESVSKETGIPPMLIAAIHYRESSMNFGTYLHQGDKLGKPAVHVPSNIPVFNEWSEAAVHALNMKKSIRDQVGLTGDSVDPVAMATYAEAYNGLGYHNKGLASPYLYAGSDVYTGGMYVADGKFSSTAKDKRLGVMTILKAMEGFDPKAVGAPDMNASSAAWQRVMDGEGVLKKDSHGDAVTALQLRMKASGVEIDADGKFGPKTKSAVIAFQKANGLKPDGIVGPATSALLQSQADKAEAAKKAPTAPGTPAPAKPAAPATGAPKTEEAKVDAPKTEEPAKVEAPKTEEPAKDAPKTETGKTGASPAMKAAADAYLAKVPADMKEKAAENVPRILAECAAAGVTDPNQVAYILATAQHESGFGKEKYSRSVSLVEDNNRFTKNADGTWSAKHHLTGKTVTANSEAELDTLYWNKAYGHRTDLGNRPGTNDGSDYRGRGFVQLTGRDNYSKMTNILSEQGYTYTVDGVTYGTKENPIDLLKHPDHVNLAPDLAARILVEGMVRGSFTSKKLDDYIDGDDVDFFNARKIINGKDRAGDIEKIAIKYSESGADWSAAVKDPVVKTEPVQATPAAPAKETKPGEVVVADPTKKEGSQPAPTGAKLTPDQQKQHLTEIDSILAAKWGATKVGRDVTTDETSAKLVQRSLVELGYLPAGTKIDGKWGPISTNALMAFQVANSGVDKIEKGVDASGKPIYMTDKDDPRLKGIVTGKLDEATKKKLLDSLTAQKDAINKDGALPELKIMRELGDTPEQKAALEKAFKANGMDPALMKSLDTNAYSKLGLRPHVLASAIDGWENAYAAGATKSTIVTVTDYELPGNMRRTFTIDLAKMGSTPILHEVMAHGSGTDKGDGSGIWSTKFSGAQSDGSHQSMLGGFIAGRKGYQGSKVSGTTVEGLEKGVNDMAEPRLVRTHAPTKDTWNSESVIGRNMGYHSWGCMVMDRQGAADFKKLTESQGGTYMFNFSPHEQYWKKTNAVNGD